ncbi:DNA glycosylase AlkZ-like family protein, partial [Sinorhizobium fredii]
GGKPRPSYAFTGFSDNLGDVPDPPSRIRVLSPFDPLLRDRNRTDRLFGFFYRIEVFVPEAKREYGYYVFPLLEGDRLIGRIDMKADRKRGSLEVRRLWLEQGVKPSSGRIDRVMAELDRIARFAGVGDVNLLEGWNASLT